MQFEIIKYILVLNPELLEALYYGLDPGFVMYLQRLPHSYQWIYKKDQVIMLIF